MNVLKLNEILSGNVDNIIKVVESMGYEDIKEHKGSKGYISFPNLDGDNKSACNIYIDSLNYNNYTRGKKGNIYTLIMDTESINFPKALDYVAKVLELDTDKLSQNIVYPFGGFYRNIIQSIEEPELAMLTYSPDILKEYEGQYSRMFFEDGISYDSQKEFGVGYDVWTNRITIPEFTFDGKLCGIMGRLNDKNCAHEERWLPIIPCSRSLTLYGYCNNYKEIKQKDLSVVLESEKGPMQLASFKCNIGLGTCGKDISEIQARYIRGLNTSRTILAFDEGLDEEYIREQAKKLKNDNCMYKNYVGYIYDKNHDILRKGSKASPSDVGKAKFIELVKKHTIWL